MSAPTRGSWKGLLKLGKYLKNHCRSGYTYPYQDSVKELIVWTDTDYAGCKRTRKSTSGGTVMWGSHLIKSWSSTQSVVALSSGEAEYYGLVKAVSKAMGIQALLRDFGIHMTITANTDASAAKGIALRQALGKARHLNTSQLLLQYKVANDGVKTPKIPTHSNHADAITKHVNAENIAKHCNNVTKL